MASSVVLFPGIVWFLCLFCFLCSLPLAICNETENDRQALLCFKSRLSGPAGVLASWSNTSLDVCDWHGITCSTVSPRRVIELDLNSEGISGPISPCIANLTSLERLQLSNNNFNGGIPSKLGLLSRLRELNLSKNTLEGNIPPSLGSSRSLTYVNLGMNALTGVIPESLANSPSLQVLLLMSNRLSGKLPKALFNTSSLLDIFLQKNNLVGSIPVVTATSPPIQYLDLSYNHISGKIPSSLGNLSSLIDLRLTENNLVGHIPDSLGHISTLEILTLTANNLSGAVPPSLFNMSSVTFLGVANNSLVGRLPSNIGYTLPNIQDLILSSNKFDGPIPASLPKAYNLRQLYLYNNSLTGFIPFFGSLPNLEELDLSYNKLEAGDWEFVSSLANCTRLTMLMLVGNNLQGEMPSSIGNLSDSLEWLWLRENQISGPIPPEIGNLKSLRRLYMDYNLITGNIPATIGNLHSLVRLPFGQNRLSGQIPDTIGNLVQLNSLKLDGNNISGRIPADIGHCNQLQILNLAHNSLDGNIPSEIFKISSLSEELDLSHNYLSGGVPVEVGNLINVNKISISDNRLSGNIPSTLGQCVVLEYLDISHNNLSGKIPQFLTSLSSLKNLNLSFNNFDGAVPGGGIFNNTAAVSVEGNHDLCTSIPTGGIPLCSTQVDRKGQQNASALLTILLQCQLKEIMICVPAFQQEVYLFVQHKLTEKGNKMQQRVDFIDSPRGPHTSREEKLLPPPMPSGLCPAALAGGGRERDGGWRLFAAGRGHARIARGGATGAFGVLLGSNMVAYVTDFGLARFVFTTSNVEEGDSTSLACLKGSIGYTPPEYGMSAEISTKGDVYSFGVLLLQMITGRSPTDKNFSDGASLHEFVHRAFPNNICDVVDQTMLEDDSNAQEIIKNCVIPLVRIGLSCSMTSPKERPDMGQVSTEILRIKHVASRMYVR
ncbi:receptor kinase-like protein Xa21 [Triticum aestivum]|uniref:receptor kinase-like protein Xa21 n=1 Tax=Triticum aestivum TaxID=4565 RepID=UPI001D026817|nr:receptor kinase-like protein Xa21 [Triticum aestivum]